MSHGGELQPMGKSICSPKPRGRHSIFKLHPTLLRKGPGICLFGIAKKLIQTSTVGAGTAPPLVFGSSQCPTRPNLLQMGEEVHLKGDRRASPLPLWRLATRLVQKQCSHLQLDLLPSRGMAGMDLQGNTNRIDKRSRPPTVKCFSSFPRSLPSLPPPSSYISLYSHLRLRSNALL